VKVFLDTHVVALLRDGRRDAFTPLARDAIERATLFYSPIVRLELGVLREIGRLVTDPRVVLDDLAAYTGARESEERLSDVVDAAGRLEWTRDPFDRLIVATAVVHRASLITRDERIRTHFPDAVW
jgi:PIN domain nuclease of toxin-antitoxin system